MADLEESMAHHAYLDQVRSPAHHRSLPLKGLAIATAALALLAVAGCQAELPAAAGNGSATTSTVSAADRSGVSGGILFGGDLPLVTQEPYLGRRLAIVRDYYRIGQRFPNQQDKQLMAGGTTMLVSLDTVPGGPSYAEIAKGRQDHAIRAFLADAERAAVRYRLAAIYVTFEHEPETGDHAGLGSPSQFVRAWDHVHHLAESMSVDWNEHGRLHWVWILTSGAFRTSIADLYWPGVNEVDIVGVDGYNTGGCRHAPPGTNLVIDSTEELSPATLFGSAVSFANAHGKLPVFIPEWGTVPYASPSLQARYIQQVQAYVTRTPEIEAVLYWDNHGQGNGCDYNIDANPVSVQALAAMGRAPAFQGRPARK